jgi:hypothetical protein
MRLRRIAIPLTVLTLIFGSMLLSAQANTNAKRILGYQDPETGVFHPLLRAVPDVTTPPTTGTFKVTLNITVKSAFPTGTTRTILCNTFFDVTAIDQTDAISSYSESAYKDATGGSGAFTCTLTIPYSWVLPTTTLQKTLTGEYQVTVTNSTATAGPAILRLSTGDFLSTSTIPANGSTSSFTVNVTI